MDPRQLYESNDIDWLRKPDTSVEGQWVERKRWCDGKEMARQVSALANGQPPGGLLVLGVEKDGSVAGLGDRIAAAQDELGRLDRSVDRCGFEHRFVPCATPAGTGDSLLYVHVPFSKDRVVCTSDGRAFARLGAEVKELSSAELTELRYARGEREFDAEPLAPFDEKVLDSDLARSFVEARHRRNGLTLDLALAEELEQVGLVARHGGECSLTAAGLLALGAKPTAYLPGARVRFLRFDGRDERFGAERNVVKDLWFDGAIPRLVTSFRNFMRTQVREFDYLGSEARFVTEAEYPEFAWDEAVVNALVHRSYSLANATIFARMFDDRVEVESPGGFPGTVTAENLQTYPRNRRLAEALAYLELVRLAREGTRRMRNEMEKLGLPPPEFREVNRSIVVVTLRNDIDRRRARLGAGDAQAQWEEVARLLSDDLALLRQKGTRKWMGLASRGSIPPPQAQAALLRLLRDSTLPSRQALELVSAVNSTDRAWLNVHVSELAVDLAKGVFARDSELQANVGSWVAATHEGAEKVLGFLEERLVAEDALEASFGALRYRVSIEPTPSREWLARVLQACTKYPGRGEAERLFTLVTGRPYPGST